MSSVIQRSFAGGEIAPSLYARTDTAKYATGARTIRNFLVMRHGGAASRPGTTFIGEVNDSTKTVRLLPFEFNDSQTYVLEFGDLYMRVIRDGSYQSDLSLTITGISNASPGVVTYTGTDPSNGEEVYISGVVGNMANYINGRNFKIANVNSGANTFELQNMAGVNVDTSSWGTYTSGGTAARIYTITTPYVEADLSTLQIAQSADVITIAHPNYAPRELSRTGHTSWTLATITFAPSISAPASPSNTGAGGSTTEWVVTAIASETFEESLQSVTTGSSATPSSATPITVSWSAVTGAGEYNVYKKKNGIYGFIGTAGSTSFVDNGITADTTDTPPTARNPFGSTDNYPSTVTYIQQRRAFANTNNDPETVWTSRVGQYANFTVSNPLQDDDAVTFTLAGRKVNEVRHLLDIGTFIVLTSGGEYQIPGNSNGALVPGEVNPKGQTYQGASEVSPIIIGGSVIFVQARGTVVRDLGFDYQTDGYRGNDLTIFSTHLFDGYMITDWAYQQIPHSIVWAVRDDGTLLGLTYVKDQQMVAWHRHDFDGTVEQVCVVPEGDEDALYLVIKRTIDGHTKRYVERMETRLIDDIVDYVGMDCALSYDGRNTSDSHSMTLSGSGWTYTDTLTLTSSTSFFSASDVDNEIHLVGSDGTIIRFHIDGYTSGTVVTGRPHKTVPASMQATAITDWTRAVDEITGLWHLEGQDVSVFADGFVVGSPNNQAYTTITVTNGVATLNRAFGVVHVGLPITADIETLDIDTPQGQTIADRDKLVTGVSMYVENSRGAWAGTQPPSDDDDDPLEGLYEVKQRESEPYDDPVDLATEVIEINLESRWNSNGRVFIRQVDPVPLTVLSIVPNGNFPFSGG